jgi:hypothetical protein
LAAKKASYNMLISFYTWMAAPFFWVLFSRLRGENRTKEISGYVVHL